MRCSAQDRFGRRRAFHEKYRRCPTQSAARRREARGENFADGERLRARVVEHDPVARSPADGTALARCEADHAVPRGGVVDEQNRHWDDLPWLGTSGAMRAADGPCTVIDPWDERGERRDEA